MTLADILDDEIAGIARERAKGMMDLHCSMSEARREKLERKNRLTYKFKVLSTLDNIDAINGNDEVANEAATKGNIADLKIESDDSM